MSALSPTTTAKADFRTRSCPLYPRKQTWVPALASRTAFTFEYSARCRAVAESALMRALQYDAYGPVERLTLRDTPSPRPAAGPLVRVTVAALNPKDALVRKGKFKVLSGRRFPKHCGVDFAGVVEAPYGDLRADDAVFGALSEWRFARGTLAEFVAPRAAEMARIPVGVAEADAAAVALVGLTALQALRDVARAGRGTSVLINGASGGVGTVAVQIARILGARVTTVSSAATAALCRSLGADETLDYPRLDDAISRSC
jgi:NADPH:quinone reductase-like Zn-dependent oxidoreductase